MTIRAYHLIGTTESDGTLQVDAGAVLGELIAVRWIDVDFDAGVDAALKVLASRTGDADLALLTLTDADAEKMYYPRALEQGPTGSDLATYTPQFISGSVRLNVTSGGNAKSGGMILYVRN